MPRRSSLTPEQFDKVIFPVLERFLVAGERPAHIARELSEEFDVPLNREGVYPLLREAVVRQYLLLSPPRERVLSGYLRQFPNHGEVRVANVRGPGSGDHVAAMGGDLTFDLIMRIAEGRGFDKAVHIAFGIGRMTRKLVERLAARLRAEEQPPRLVVHAISPPFSVTNPLDNPISAFAYLAGAVPDVEFISFTVAPIVKAEEYQAALRPKVVRHAIDQKGDIDIVITSLAAASDDHGYLKGYLRSFAGKQTETLSREGWVGDVQLRPYGTNGPIKITKGLRPVTMFELSDLVQLSTQDGKHVVVLVSACGRCNESKAQALLPLLEEPTLHVWDHLVLDADTASDIMGSRKTYGARPASLGAAE